MEKKQSLGSLFWQFFKFGCFTFGGGWSIVSQMQRVYVEERKCITNDDLLDLISVGRSLPGTMIGNVAMIFGVHQGGALGGAMCVLGVVLPPMAILAVITLFYTAFRDSYWVAAAMSGVRAAVVPIILSAGLPMIKSALARRIGLFIALAALAAYLFGVGCVWLVLGGAVAGIVIKALRLEGGDGA